MAAIADKLKMAVAINKLIMAVAADKVKIVMAAIFFSLSSICFRNSMNPLRN